jgi:tRNA (cmo5U34)-methyltransferase
MLRLPEATTKPFPARVRLHSGFPADRMAKAVGAIRDGLPVLSPQDDEALMGEAGLRDVSPFYAALTFRGWVAYA